MCPVILGWGLVAQPTYTLSNVVVLRYPEFLRLGVKADLAHLKRSTRFWELSLIRATADNAGTGDNEYYLFNKDVVLRTLKSVGVITDVYLMTSDGGTMLSLGDITYLGDRNNAKELVFRCSKCEKAHLG